MWKKAAVTVSLRQEQRIMDILRKCFVLATPNTLGKEWPGEREKRISNLN